MPTAAPFVPPGGDLEELREAARGCTGCDLYRYATQVVFGEGPEDAELMIVGEQPGDQEDKKGRPFVGPAGRLLDRALEDAQIDRARVYVTNAVKHFKWKGAAAATAAAAAGEAPMKKRRLHDKPSTLEIKACRPWFDAELERVRPSLVVLMGATAVKSLLGTAAQVTRDRGRIIAGPDHPPVLVTVHPSALLRITEREDRDRAYQAFVADLSVAAAWLAEHRRPRRARRA